MRSVLFVFLAGLEVRCVEGEKKDRPQNKNLKPLGSGLLTPEEELAIRRKGKVAADRSRKRNADIRAAVRAIANLNAKGKGKSKEVEKLTSVQQLQEDGAPMISQMVYAQFILASQGDKEARDWICQMLGIEKETALTSDGANTGETTEDGVRIHLIRGEKPAGNANEEDEATRAAARLATAEAMKAVNDAIEKERQNRQDGDT